MRTKAFPARDSLLAAAPLAGGFSLSEGLFVIALVGILVGLAASSVPVAMLHVSLLEAVSLSTGPKINSTLYWAETGDYPGSQSDGQQRLDDLAGSLHLPKGESVGRNFDEFVRGDGGSFGFVAESKTGPRSGAVYFRPAIAGGSSPTAIAWICGHAAAPNGFAMGAPDMTTMENRALPSPCRSRGIEVD